jgi:nucleotide-binding universal stress UspA family protein
MVYLASAKISGKNIKNHYFARNNERMVNILVPTDFSDLSKIAVKYAVKIANGLSGNVTLLHVINLEQKMLATLRMQIKSREVVKGIQQNFKRLIDEVSSEMEVNKPVKFQIAEGRSFGETIMKESRKLRSGLIVMGTRGASGIRKAVLGSNTASLIGESHIPVLAVPEQADFENFHNLIYATDMKNLEGELAILMPYVERFGSIVHILHIVEDASKISVIEDQINAIIKKAKYKNIVTLVTFDLDIDGAIEQYISVAKADLLTMFTHEPSFFEKIFDRSVTRKMAFQSRIPLLAFKTK